MRKILDAVSTQNKYNQEQIEKENQEFQELAIDDDNDIFASFVPKTIKTEKVPITQGATKILSILKFFYSFSKPHLAKLNFNQEELRYLIDQIHNNDVTNFRGAPSMVLAALIETISYIQDNQRALDNFAAVFIFHIKVLQLQMIVS